MNEEIGKLVEKSEHALIVANELMQHGHAPDAAVRFTTPCSMRPRPC